MEPQKQETLPDPVPSGPEDKLYPLVKKKKSIPYVAIISFFVSFAFCAFLISATIADRSRVQRIRIEQHIFERTHRISDTISKLLYKAQALSALITHNDTDNFEVIALSIADDYAIKNVLFAPSGIVTKVYPAAGNDSLIGLDFFRDNKYSREALLAKEKGELVLGGPFEMADGIQALAGIMPVYIDALDEKQVFWGFVSVTIRFPQVLEYSELEIFKTFGYAHELWKLNPETGDRQLLDCNYEYSKGNTLFMEKPVHIYNSEWYLRVFPMRMWYSYPENIALIFAGFCISLIVFFVMRNNNDLKNMQAVFEQMATTDPLTNILNRRHFLDMVRLNVEKARRHKENCYFVMFDIDRFKLVNDTYGHQVGDKVLIEVSTRIKADIRPYDLFARYGGEEFIIFISGISIEDVCDLTERLRQSVSIRKYEYDNVSFESSASFGIAHLYDYNVDNAIKRSDEALYAAKRNGRNCVVYWQEKTN